MIRRREPSRQHPMVRKAASRSHLLLLLAFLSVQALGCSVPAARRHSATMDVMLQTPQSLEIGLGQLEERVYEGGAPRLQDDAATQDLLELGALYSRDGRFRESNELLERVFRTYVEKEEGPVISIRAAGTGVFESTVAAGVGSYQLSNYEKMYLHVIKARNYVFLEDLEGARVEVRRSHVVQRTVREQLEEEQAAVAAERVKRRKKDPQFAAFVKKLEVAAIESQVRLDGRTLAQLREIAASHENPYGMVLSGLVYWSLNESQDAALEFRRAAEVSGSLRVHALARALDRRAAGQTTTAAPNVFVFASVDRAPSKTAKNIRFLNPVSESMSKISFPGYVKRPPTVLRVEAGGQPLEPLLDVDLLAFKEYDERLPVELTKALMRFFSHTAKDAYLKKELGLVGQILGSVTNELLEGADTRCWTALPKKVYFRSFAVASPSFLVTVIGIHGQSIFQKSFNADPDRLNVIQLFSNPCGVVAQSVALPLPAARFAPGNVASGGVRRLPSPEAVFASALHGSTGH